MDERDAPRLSHCEPVAAPVPLVERCPACGGPLDGQRCKVYCANERCALYRRIIENCAGD